MRKTDEYKSYNQSYLSSRRGLFDIYVLYSVSTDKYYVGMSTDPVNRLESHNNGGTKSTKGPTDWEIIFHLNTQMCWSDASKVESFVRTYKSYLQPNLMNSLPFTYILSVPDTPSQRTIRAYICRDEMS
jgi:putative endonuclease